MACAQEGQTRPSREAAADLLMWLWMAWTSSRGKQRGRVALAVFFGLTSLSVLYSLSDGSLVYAPAAMSVGLGLWAIAAAAIMLIFNKAFQPVLPAAGTCPGLAHLRNGRRDRPFLHAEHALDDRGRNRLGSGL